MVLSELKPGQEGLICEVDEDTPEMRRLMELGILPGQKVNLIRVAPLGDPIQVKILGYDLCLRKNLASKIKIEVENPESKN